MWQFSELCASVPASLESRYLLLVWYWMTRRDSLHSMSSGTQYGRSIASHVFYSSSVLGLWWLRRLASHRYSDMHRQFVLARALAPAREFSSESGWILFSGSNWPVRTVTPAFHVHGSNLSSSFFPLWLRSSRMEMKKYATKPKEESERISQYL